MPHVRHYSLTADGDRTLAPHFRVREFACHDGSDRILIADELIAALRAIREHYRSPLTITSCYRTPAWNRKVGGVSNSQHLLGTAADINVIGLQPTALFTDIVQGHIPGLSPEKMGAGIYTSFVHIDVRGHRARWAGRGMESHL